MEFADRVYETTWSTGTGTLTLAGTRAGYRTALQAFGSGSHESEWLISAANGSWEMFRGTVTGTSLTRTTVLASSNDGDPVDFPAGMKEVRCTLSASTAAGLANGLAELATLIHRDGSVAFTANQSMGAHKLTNVADPAADQDAATKKYVDDALAANGDGDVNGPGSSTDNGIPRFDGVGGKTLQAATGATIDDDGVAQFRSSRGTGVALSDGATITWDWRDGSFASVTLGGNRTIAFSNVATEKCVFLRLKQDGTGSRTVTWPAGVVWPSGAAPTLTTTAGRTDVFGFYCATAGGSPAFIGFVLGQNVNL